MGGTEGAAHRHGLKNTRRQDLAAGKHESGQRLLDRHLTRLASNTPDRARPVRFNQAIRRLIGVQSEQQCCDGLGPPVGGQEGGQIEIKDRIRVQNQKRLAVEKRLGFLDPAAGVQDGVFRRIGNPQAVGTPVAQGFSEPMPKMVEVQHDLFNAVGFDKQERVFDQRATGDRHQRLGNRIRQRSHPGAEAGRKNHGTHHEHAS